MTSNKGAHFGESLETLGDIHASLDSHPDSARLYAMALERWLTELDDDGARVLQCRSKLAEAHSRCGCYEKVPMVLDNHLHNYEVCFGEFSEEKKSVLICIGKANRLIGDHSNAEIQLTQALEICKEHHTLDCLSSCVIYVNLALLYEAMKDSAKAMDYFIRARDVYMDKLTQAEQSTNGNLALCHLGLGRIHHGNGHFEDAKNELVRSLSIYNKRGLSLSRESLIAVELLLSMALKIKLDPYTLEKLRYGLSKIFGNAADHEVLVNRIRPDAINVLEQVSSDHEIKNSISTSMQAACVLLHGRIYLGNKQHEAAIHVLSQFSASFRQTNPRKISWWVFQIDKQIAEIYMEADNREEASRHLGQTLRFYQISTHAHRQFVQVLHVMKERIDKADIRQE